MQSRTITYLDNTFGGIQPLERNDAAIGLELNIPIYQGGLVSSQTRQARYRVQPGHGRTGPAAPRHRTPDT